MLRLLKFVALLFPVLGCAGLGVAPEQRVLLFGSIQARGGVDKVWIQRQLGFLREDVFVDAQGNFALIDAAPGTYYIAGFYQDGVLYSLYELGERVWYQVPPGEMKYAGSFVVGNSFHGGFLRPGTFDVKEREEDRERILRALLPALEKTRWAAEIRNGSGTP